MTNKYKISAKPIQGGKPLTYHVNEYTIKDGLIIFIDYKTNKKKMFAIPNVEIEVLHNE